MCFGKITGGEGFLSHIKFPEDDARAADIFYSPLSIEDLFAAFGACFPVGAMLQTGALTGSRERVTPRLTTYGIGKHSFRVMENSGLSIRREGFTIRP